MTESMDAPTADPNLMVGSGGRPFPRLLSPFRLGEVTLRNRVVNLPQGTAYTNRGRVEDEDTYYNERRAKGGVGLIITGGTAANVSSQTRSRGFIEAYDPDSVPGFRRRSEVVHGHGTHIIGQIFNLGRLQAAETMTATPIAPSALRSDDFRYAPMAMGHRQIAEVIEGFRLSATHLVAGGYDGVEIHGAHGYLLAQFLSAVTNRRDDAYGGDLAGRNRLLVEVLQAVRAAVGDDFIVGVRLSVDDEEEGGTNPSECQATLERLRQAVKLDYVSLAVGVRGGYVKDSTIDEGVALERIATIKAGTPVPVIASQRIRRPEQAEAALAAGQADLIGLARPLTADPDWVAKAQRGESHRIRVCVGDLQDCRSHLTGGLRCIVNPDVGREVVLRLASPEARKPRASLAVAIIGGGPAGLEAARRSCESGHSVTLYEAGSALGGQVLMAARAHGRAELADLIRFQTTELQILGAKVLFDNPVEQADAAALDADVVIVATGAVGAPIGLRPADSTAAPIRSVWDVLADSSPDPATGRVVLIDDGTGDWPMITAAELLSDKGNEVTIVTPGASVTRSLPSESVAGLRRHLQHRSIQWMVGARHVTLGADYVVFRRDGTDERVTLPFDAVVVETGRIPNDRPWRSKADDLDGIYIVGDCLTPRGIGNAMGDAQRVDAELSALTARVSDPA